jgi:hypothetical protein
MKRKGATVLLVAATSWMIGTPVAHAATATITLNGQDIPVNGQVHCAVTNQGPTLKIGHDQGSAWVEIGQSPSWSHQPTNVTEVRIGDTGGATYQWAPFDQFTNGDVEYQGPTDPDRESAGDYKITGHIPMVMVPQYPAPGAPPPIGGNRVDQALLPFEIDATCP